MREAPRFVMTMDTDWAPQFVINHALAMLAEHAIPTTIFCTSPYNFPRKLLDEGNLEIALHPNFMPDSTQGPAGASEEDRLRHLLEIYPEAKGSRSHRLYWHSGIRKLLMRNGLTYDASIFCPLQSHLKGYDYYGLTRFPIWWADGYHLMQKFSLNKFEPPGIATSGLKILNFHPIHIYCNTRDLPHTKERLARFRLEEASPSDLAPLRSHGVEIEKTFAETLKRLATSESTALLSELKANNP